MSFDDWYWSLRISRAVPAWPMFAGLLAICIVGLVLELAS